MVSAANIFAIPYITKFAVLVMLISFIFISKESTIENKLFAAFISSLVLTYVRPEFFLSMLLIIFATAIYLFGRVRTGKRILTKRPIGKVIFIVLAFMLLYIFNPVSRHRADEAFTQHYAMDIGERESQRIQHPGDIIQQENLMKEDFSTDYSIIKSFMNNPKLFLEHVLHNFLRLKDTIPEVFPFFITKNAPEIIQMICYFIASYFIFIAFYFFGEGVFRKKFSLNQKIYFFFSIPSVVSVLIFYPRQHYMIFVIVFWLIYLSYEITLRKGNSSVSEKNTLKLSLTAGILFLIIIPFRAGSNSIHQSGCTTLKTIFAINNLKVRGPVNFLSADPIISTYAQRDWNYINSKQIKDQADNFIELNKVNLILADEILLSNPSIRNEGTIQKYLRDTNYAQLKIQGCNTMILVKKEILEESQK